jgi:hypothetical protein
MKKADNEYLADIIATTSVRKMKKFKKGNKEHGGGHIWEVPGMLKNLEEELDDAEIYTYTLRFQLETCRTMLITKNYQAALGLLNDILSYDDSKEA